MFTITIIIITIIIITSLFTISIVIRFQMLSALQ